MNGPINLFINSAKEMVYDDLLFFFREPVGATPDSLDPRHVFLVDGGLKIFVWYGRKCKNVLKSKARLMAEKINKTERKDKVRSKDIML